MLEEKRMSVLNSSSDVFEDANTNLSYSSHSLNRSKSNDLLLNQNFTHKRVVSNPFDVIYNEAQKEEDKRNSGQSFNTFRTPTSPFIPNTPGAPRNMYFTPKRVINESPPILTIIDQNQLNRSTSVISKSASLRNRYNIVKRNKMINKKIVDAGDSDADENYKKENRKGFQSIRFLFPVQRKTSFKQKSSYKLLREFRDRSVNFKTKQDLEEFLIKSRASQIMRELLPSQMKVFDYSNIFMRNPKLNKHERFFNINEANEFNMISPRALISQPFKSTLVKNDTRYVSGVKEFNLLDSIYSRYRNKAFNSGVKVPLKFTDYFPDELDSDLVTPVDIDNFNKKLLFEVLLRRTLAAKIEYRLSQSGYKSKRKPKNNDSDSSQQSSSNDSEDHDNIRHSHIPELVHTESETDDDSINTDDLMQQNASLFSGLLPSPQISYKGDLFGSEFEFKPELFDDNSSGLKDENKSRRTASTSDLLNLIKQSTHTPVESNFTDLFPVLDKENGRNISWNTGFFRDTNNPNFNNPNFNGNVPNGNVSNGTAPNGNVPNRFSYDLKPISRSVETFSSEESQFKTPFELSKTNSLKSSSSTFLNRKSNEWETSSNSGVGLLIGRSKSRSNTQLDNLESDTKRTSNVTGTSVSSETLDNHRKSHSTTNSSIFQDLDDLSSQLSTYLNDPKDQKRFVHKNILTEDDPLFSQPMNLSNENIKKVQLLPNKKQANTHYSPDITSMKGSVIGTNSESSYYSYPKHSKTASEGRVLVNEAKRRLSNEAKTRNINHYLNKITER